jgi:hypothetical protein
MRSTLLTVHTQGVPLEQMVLHTPGASLPMMVSRVMHAGEQPCSQCAIGEFVFFGMMDASEYPENYIAQTLARNIDPQCEFNPRGPVVITGKDGVDAISLGRVSLKRLQKMVPTHMIQHGGNRRSGPAPPKLAFWYFIGQFHTRRRKELTDNGEKPVFTVVVKEARAVWASMTTDERAPYESLARTDTLRYDREYADYLRANPDPPIPPASAAKIYKAQRVDKTINWSSLSRADRQVFIEAAVVDAERYSRALSVYREWCHVHGIDFDARMNNRGKGVVPAFTATPPDAPAPDAPAADAPAAEPPTVARRKRKRPLYTELLTA